MAANPNPTYITDAVWEFWENFDQFEPDVVLGGIYANKPGYHNTRWGNSSSNYSVVLPPDKLGPGDKASAIDLTFNSAHSGNYAIIDKYSSRLLAAGQRNDIRAYGMREFFGQADSDSAVEGWDYYYDSNSSSDPSHLWHIHISFHRRYLNDRKALDGILSILKGESIDAWVARWSPDKIYIEGVGLATLNDVAKAVWEYKLNDMVLSQKNATATSSTAGNQVRYARTDSFKASHGSDGKSYYVNDVITDIVTKVTAAIKALFP